jgi:hypothetical protein
VGFRGDKNPFVAAVLLAGAVPLLVTAAFAQVPATQPIKPDDDKIVQDFETRVSHYLDERRKQAGSSPKPSSSPEKLEDAQQTLAQKAKVARAEAEHGDIFTPETAAYFRRQINSALAGRRGAKIRASLQHAEPVQNVPLRVNQVYPDKAPLQSMPPSLLLKLPPLPKELQYRLVGRNLVLLDVVPKIIVDFIPEAMSSNKE